MGSIRSLRYHVGKNDSFKIRGHQHSGVSTPVPRHYPIEGVLKNENLSFPETKPALERSFQCASVFSQIRSFSVYEYRDFRLNISDENLCSIVLDTIPLLPKTLEILELRLGATWTALLDRNQEDYKLEMSKNNNSKPKSSTGGAKTTTKKTEISSSSTTSYEGSPWLPLYKYFPSLKVIALSSSFFRSMKDLPDFRFFKHFLSCLPTSTLEVLDVDFLDYTTYTKVTTETFPRLTSLSIMTYDENTNDEMPAQPIETWAGLPTTLHTLSVPSLVLNEEIMHILPATLDVLEIFSIDQRCDPFTVHHKRVDNSRQLMTLFTQQNAATTAQVEDQLDRDEEAFLRLSPVQALPLPKYLSTLKTAHSCYWTRTLIRRIPSSVSTFEIKKMFSYQLRPFALLGPHITSFVVHSLSQKLATRVASAMTMNIETFDFLAKTRVQHFRIASSISSLKCNLGFVADSAIPLFGRTLTSIVLPRVSFPENCLLALPKTLMRLDVETIRTNGTLLHYFSHIYHSNLQEKGDGTHTNFEINLDPQMHAYRPPIFMKTNNDFFVKWKDIPEDLRCGALLTKPITKIDSNLVIYAVSLFLKIHFPGLQGFFPPITCVSLQYAPPETQEIEIESSAIPTIALPSLTRLRHYNSGRYNISQDLMPLKYLTELDWTDSRLPCSTHTFNTLSKTVIYYRGSPNSLKYEELHPGRCLDDTVEQYDNPFIFYDWRSTSLLKTPRKVDIDMTPMDEQNRSESSDSCPEEKEEKAENPKIENSEIDEKHIEEKDINDWRRELCGTPITRMTLPDDVGRVEMNFTQIQLLGGASIHHNMKGMMMVRTFPRGLRELILRGTGLQARVWSTEKVLSLDDYSYALESEEFDPTFMPLAPFPEINSYAGQTLYYRPWNWKKPKFTSSSRKPTRTGSSPNQSDHTSSSKENTSSSGSNDATKRGKNENKSSNDSTASQLAPTTLSKSGNSRYNDASAESNDSIALYPSTLKSVKFAFGAFSHYPFSILPSWLVQVHFERHIIRPSLIKDIGDYLPVIQTIIITNGCRLENDLKIDQNNKSNSAMIVKSNSTSVSAVDAWDGKNFPSLLPNTLTTLVLDEIVLPLESEDEFKHFPSSLSKLYLAKESKFFGKEIVEWISKHKPSDSQQQKSAWLEQEIISRHPPILRGSDG